MPSARKVIMISKNPRSWISSCLSCKTLIAGGLVSLLTLFLPIFPENGTTTYPTAPARHF